MYSVDQLLEGYKQGKFSTEEIVLEYLQRIEQCQNLNIFCDVYAEQAIAQAKQIDQLRAKGQELGALAGIPIAHKSLFCEQGKITSACSKTLKDYVASYDATVVRKLASAGVVTLGKTNMDEFAMGSSTEHTYFGKCINPWKTNYSPGGSSGGSAAAVAGRLVCATTGTDTGGSIRQPAAHCGVTGIKPTYGRVSRYGMVAFASSFDQAGIFAESARDCAHLLCNIAEYDAQDSTSVNVPKLNFDACNANNLKGLKVGIVKEHLVQSVNPALRKKFEETLEWIKSAGGEIQEVSLPLFKLSIPLYHILAQAEASSNLARYDNIRYGVNYKGEDIQNAKDIESLREMNFGTEVKRRIIIGNFVLSSSYYDSYYKKAQQCRRLFRDDFIKCFNDVDMILTYTTSDTAFEHGTKQDPMKAYAEDLFTIAANLAGLPAASFPVGLNENLPMGLQVIGNHFAEEQLLSFMHSYQQDTNFHTLKPEIS